MVLTPADAEKILAKVKKEPCLVQDLAQHLHKSWVTTERYVTKLAQEKGLVKVKTFREGTKGAIKVVYWNYPESAKHEAVIFAGIVSFLNVREGENRVTDFLEELLERGIPLRILCKVDVESLG